jgi:pumilio family protein 6
MQEEFNEGEFTLDNQGDFNEEIGEELVQEKTAQDLEKQRLARKEQKQQTLQRKLQKPNFDLIIEAKGIWEQLRQKRLTKPERKELIDKMMALVSGKALDVFYLTNI